jgi:hypothetical protein
MCGSQPNMSWGCALVVFLAFPYQDALSIVRSQTAKQTQLNNISFFELREI